MCIVFIANRCRPDYPLIIAANRDEFYDRPASPLDFWEDYPQVAAGRDMEAGGTWLGITTAGRFAAVTNFRDPRSIDPSAPSRGTLVRDFLVGSVSPRDYLLLLKDRGKAYNGFNLVAGDMEGVYYYSNVERGVHELSPGIHGLSNHLMDTPWPKVETGKNRLLEILSGDGPVGIEDVLAVLSDTARPPDSMLPDTGVGMEWERVLSSIFVRSPVYGTRCSSVIIVDREGGCVFVERTFEPGAGEKAGSFDRVIRFRIGAFGRGNGTNGGDAG
ncbi:MAG: hypothetical protein B5M56_01260 [Desulfococcus sp. 4484_241]|nr:MAG: hypothetical protein B5M56_01260 [Desulfococcus sp. 4484_241]